MGSAAQWIVPVATLAVGGAAIAATGGAAAPAVGAIASGAGFGAALPAATTAGSLLTAGNVALGATALSGLASTFGSYQAAQAQNAAAKYDAAAADQSAELARRAADDAQARGADELGSYSLRRAQLEGTQRTALAATGVDLQSGSALDVMTDSAFLGELDAAAIRANAEREVYAASIGGANATGRARQLRSTVRSPLLGAGTTLIGGANAVADRWLTMQG